MKLLVSLFFCLTLFLWACKKEQAFPSISPLSIQSVGVSSVVVSVNIINGGSSAIVQRGFCWSTTHNPSKESSQLRIATGSSQSLTDTIHQLHFNTQYYIRFFATNERGTTYSNEDSFTTQNSPYTIGQQIGQSYIFYIDSTGEHGLMAGKISSEQKWNDCWWADCPALNTTSPEFGTGKANTLAILAAIDTSKNSAAKWCDRLVFDGHDDWYLPSYQELLLFRNNMPFSGWLFYPMEGYWSSSEYNVMDAYFTVFGGGASFYNYEKDVALGVVPVRSF